MKKDFFSCLAGHPHVYASEHSLLSLQQPDAVYFPVIKILDLRLLTLLLSLVAPYNVIFPDLPR